MRKMKKKITTAIKNNFDLLKEANKRISELEETIVLNTCREITKPYCPMRIADLDQIKENKKQIDVLKLNQTDGTPNQNFVAIHILKNGFTQIGLKIENRFDKIEVILRELHELMRSLVSDLQDSNSLSKATIKCYEGKLIKNLEKLDSKKEYKYFDFDTKEYSWGKYYDLGIIKSKNGNLHDYTPSQFVKDYAKTHTLFSLHGVMFSEPKEKATELETEPEKELYELYLKDGGQYYFKKITHPFTEYNNMVHLAIGKIVVNRSDKQELIEGVQDKLEFLRDKVLEAPILSGSVQDLRDHIHDLKDLVVKSIEEYEGMLK